MRSARSRCALCAACTALALFAVAPRAGRAAGCLATPSRLALESEWRVVPGTTQSGPLLAQRTITREWGPSEDSIYVEKDVPDWRSEGAAMTMSALIPGTGQVYADGAGWKAAAFALVEVIGWSAHLLLRNSGNEVRSQAAQVAGPPADSTSNWSIARWTSATNADPGYLERLYAVDRESFYDLIAEDPLYAQGWNTSNHHQEFYDLRATSDRRLHGARASLSLLWMNHFASAFDAFRLARTHNVSLGPALGLDIKSGWHRGPELTAILVRKF